MATYNIVLTNAPAFYYQVVGSPGFTRKTIPTGAIKTTDRSRHAEYKRQHYLVGSLTKNLTFIEADQSLVITGITTPASVPTIATGAAGSPTGTMIGYISFRHKIGSTIIHESSLSAATNTISCTSQKVSWTSIPGTSPDSRVTHVVLYRSVDGADPREVVELTIGTTSYTDNVATSALGQVGLTNNDPPPQARFIFLYHDRAWYVSVAHPERTYFSEIGFPEAVGTASYITTRDGETVTGLNKVLDQLVVFCRRCTYDIQGYTVDDFNMRKVHPAVGCISNDAAVNISERLFFPAEDGVWIYNGASFTYTMDEIHHFWRDDYFSNILRYNNVVAANDRRFSVYRLLLKKPTSPKSFYYIGHYDNIDQGKPVQWTFDIRAREDNVVGEMDAGNGQLESYTGSCDGNIRLENVDSDADDDGDSYAKAFDLLLRTDNFEEVAAGSTTAKTFKDVNVYLRAESNSWTLKLWAGEEDATDQASPTQSISVAASAVSGYIGKNAHSFRPLGVSGLCLAPEITATSPLSMKFRGWDVNWLEGPSSRGRST